MKKLLSLLAVGLISIGLVACDDGEISKESTMSTSNKETEEVVEVEETEEVVEEVEEEIGTRTNPIKVDESVFLSTTLSDYEKDLSAEAEFEITISNVVRGQEAFDILLAENQFNEPAPEGFEWVLFDIELNANIADENLSYYAMPSFNVFDENGSPITQESAVTPNEFGWVDVYNGGTVAGTQSILAPIEESVLVEYSEFEFSYFFTLE